MGRHKVNLLPSCLEMPAVAFTASCLGDLQAPPGQGDDISAGELAAFIAGGRLPLAKRTTVARPQRQRWDKRSGQQSQHSDSVADGQGGLLSSAQLKVFSFDSFPLKTCLLGQRSGDCWDSFAVSGKCQETSFLVASGCRGCCLPCLAGATCNIFDRLHYGFVLLVNTASTWREGQIIGVPTIAGTAALHSIVHVASVCPVYGARHPPPPEGMTSLLGSDLVCLLDIFYALKTQLRKKNTFVCQTRVVWMC